MYRFGVVISLFAGLLFAYLSLNMSVTNNGKPGPGLWPFLLSLVIITASIVSLLFEKDSSHFEGFTKHSRSTLYAIISLAVFVILFESLGFLLSGFLLLIFWFKFLGKESWRLSVSTSIILTCSFYFVFVYLLKIPFPEDFFLLQ